MVIRIIVERSFLPSCREQGLALIMKLRAQAIMSSGYLLGTVWEDVNIANNIITSDGWESIERWTKFKTTTEVREILGQIQTLLAGPSKECTLTEPVSKIQPFK